MLRTRRRRPLRLPQIKLDQRNWSHYLNTPCQRQAVGVFDLTGSAVSSRHVQLRLRDGLACAGTPSSFTS